MIYLDTETHAIRPGLQAPPIVCVQHTDGIGEPEVALYEDVRDKVAQWVAGEVMVGHNLAYDMACVSASSPGLLPAVFAAYREGRIIDTHINERLLRIAEGTSKMHRYDLASVCKAHAIETYYHVGQDGQKEEYWRTRYSQLEGIPVAEWPPDAVRYAREDVRVLPLLLQSQRERFPVAWLEDAPAQARASWWIHLMRTWGMVTDPEAAAALLDQLAVEEDVLRAELTAEDLVRPNGTKNLAVARERVQSAYDRLGLDGPQTDKQQVSTSRDACAKSGDPVLRKFAEYTSIGALKARCSRLSQAYPQPIQARFTVVIDSGRTSSSIGAPPGGWKPGSYPTAWGDQMQNQNRKPGLRECYRARQGRVLISADWSTAELHALAEVCHHLFGRSALGERLVSGEDVHLALGADVFRWPLVEAKRAKNGELGSENKKRAKQARMMGKVGNFGVPGGMGASGLRTWASATYGIELSETAARTIIGAFMRSYPEMRAYFAQVKLECSDKVRTPGLIRHIYSNRYRGGCMFTQAANTRFQGLTADMAKDAGFKLSHECYVDTSSVLYGSRIVNFIHDEFLVESPQMLGHECAMRVVQIMEDAGRRWCSQYPVRAEPAVMLHWRKDAEAVYNSAGRLVCWEHRALSDDETQTIRSADNTWAASWLGGVEYTRAQEIRS